MQLEKTQSAPVPFAEKLRARVSIVGYWFFGIAFPLVLWNAYGPKVIELFDAQNFLDEATDHYSRDRKDPSSLQFRDLFVMQYTPQAHDRTINLCGQVNEKNEFGAYTGFKWFIVTASDTGKPRHFFEQLQGPHAETTSEQLCSEKVPGITYKRLS